jgi:hypothetical protein
MALDLLKSVTGRTLIESHRGSVGHAPENSWTAIKTGHQLGADLIEIDVQMSSQQSVHLTLGILRTSQAVFYALSFFWLDGFAVPAPAQVPITAPVKGHSKIIFLYVPDRITRAARIIKLPRLFFWHNLFLNRQRSAILVTACEFMMRL